MTKVIQGNCVTQFPAVGSQRWVTLEQTVMKRAKYYKGYKGEYLETWIGVKSTALPLKRSANVSIALCFLAIFTPHKIRCLLPALDSHAYVYEDIVKLDKYISKQYDRGEWLLCKEPKRSCSIDNNFF